MTGADGVADRDRPGYRRAPPRPRTLRPPAHHASHSPPPVQMRRMRPRMALEHHCRGTTTNEDLANQLRLGAACPRHRPRHRVHDRTQTSRVLAHCELRVLRAGTSTADLGTDPVRRGQRHQCRRTRMAAHQAR